MFQERLGAYWMVGTLEFSLTFQSRDLYLAKRADKMADESESTPASELRRVHEEIAEYGYALTTEWDIGLPPKCEKNFQRAYFNIRRLRHDKGDRPHDRKRARDVILYEWNDGQLTLEEYETIAIWDRSEIKGERIHKRIELLKTGRPGNSSRHFLASCPKTGGSSEEHSESICSGRTPTSYRSHIRTRRSLLSSMSWTGKATVPSLICMNMIRKRWAPKRSASRFSGSN